jgi:hypothetical protein
MQNQFRQIQIFFVSFQSFLEQKEEGMKSSVPWDLIFCSDY